MAPGVVRSQAPAARFSIEQLEGRDEKYVQIALNCLASGAVANCAFRAARAYGVNSLYIFSGVTFVSVCSLLDRVASGDQEGTLSAETLDRLARILWVTHFFLGSVLLGGLLAGLLDNGKWILAGVKERKVLTICQEIYQLSWNLGFLTPFVRMLLQSSLPFEERHIGMLNQLEEAAPGHLFIESLLAQVRSFSQQNFFTKLSFVTVTSLSSFFADRFSPLQSLAYALASLSAHYQWLQAEADVARLGMGFFLTMQMALEGTFDLEVLSSHITVLDEQAKRRWFLAAHQSLKEVDLFAILKQFSQDFPWDFLALHLQEDQFRRYIQPKLDRAKSFLESPRVIYLAEKQAVEAEILRLAIKVVFLQKNREIEGWKIELDEVQRITIALKERLNFTAELRDSFPKELLPSPSYDEVNQVIQDTKALLPTKELLRSLEKDVLSKIEGLVSGASAGVGRESIQEILAKEFHFNAQDFFFLGSGLSIPFQELMKDRLGSVAAYLHDLGLSSQKDLQDHGILDLVGNEKSMIFEKIVEVCKKLEKEKNEEESYLVLSREFQFNNETFRELGYNLGVSEGELNESPIQATYQWLTERGLSTRKELQDQGILDRPADQETAKQRIIAVCKKFNLAKGPNQPPEVSFQAPEGENRLLFTPAKIRLIFARALKGLLIFLQITENPRSTALGFLVGLGMPVNRFSFFEGNYWSLINMSRLYQMDPSQLSLDEGIFALARTLHDYFRPAMNSINYSAIGGFLSGITHARIIRRI